MKFSEKMAEINQRMSALLSDPLHDKEAERLNDLEGKELQANAHAKELELCIEDRVGSIEHRKFLTDIFKRMTIAAERQAVAFERIAKALERRD